MASRDQHPHPVVGAFPHRRLRLRRGITRLVPDVGRLRGRRAFSDLAERGRTVRSGPLRVRYLAAPGGPLVGYAIGKKVGSAVVRNRIRRRLRAASACASAMSSGFYLISTDASAASLPFDDLVGALDNVVMKLADVS